MSDKIACTSFKSRFSSWCADDSTMRPSRSPYAQYNRSLAFSSSNRRNNRACAPASAGTSPMSTRNTTGSSARTPITGSPSPVGASKTVPPSCVSNERSQADR